MALTVQNVFAKYLDGYLAAKLASVRSLGHTPICFCPVCGAQLISETYRRQVRSPPLRIAEDQSTANDFPFVKTGAA